MNEQDEQRQRELGKELASIEAAEQALQNSAIVEYFDTVEQQAIDALLNCDMLDDERRLKLTVIAQQVRKLKDFLHEKRDLRRMVESELELLKETSQ